MASTGIGERLRSARQALGLSLEEIENVTRIRRAFLVALEQETFDVLPGPTYVRGFLRTYAAYLGIPAQELIELYPSPNAGAKAGTILPRESPVEVRITPATRLSSTRRVLAGVAVLVGLGVAALGVVLYGQIRQFVETPVPAQAPPKPSTAPSTGALRSTAPAPPPVQIAPRTVPPPPPAPSGAPARPPKPAAAPGPAAVPPPSPAPSKPAPSKPGPTGTAGGTAAAPPPGKATGPGPAPLAAPSAALLHVVVAASGHSWVRTVADGTTVFEGFLNAGDKQVWEAKRTLTVKVGNAGAVDLSMNGKSLGRLGAVGEVYEHTFTAGPAGPLP